METLDLLWQSVEKRVKKLRDLLCKTREPNSRPRSLEDTVLTKAVQNAPEWGPHCRETQWEPASEGQGSHKRCSYGPGFPCADMDDGIVP